MSIMGTESYAGLRDLPENVSAAVALADGGGNGKRGAAADPEKLLRPGGCLVIDDFTPTTEWPTGQCPAELARTSGVAGRRGTPGFRPVHDGGHPAAVTEPDRSSKRSRSARRCRRAGSPVVVVEQFGEELCQPLSLLG
ncbi:hypothetical protein GCM10027447_19120 [Glycomyces halotolerans]